jgi:hypothetical protein
MRGIVVCVNYDDLLNITLVRNMRFFEECVVVTSPTDERTKKLASSIPNVRVFETDAFYRFGAKFNKGLAIEEGFEFLGREGWILIWDADTLFPSEMDLSAITPGRLYGARRYILDNPKQWHEELNWASLPVSNDKSFPGYFQLFHASDPTISQLPWYDVTFGHAGGGDGYFESRWKSFVKVRLPFKVLHLGPRDTNWFGRASPRTDSVTIEDASHHLKEMQDFLVFKGWRKPLPGRTDVTKYEEKVVVPGMPPSGYKLKGRFDH